MSKKIFITGASSGFGAAIAKVAAARGWTLGLLVRNQERFKKDFPEFAASERIYIYKADVRDAQALSEAIEAFAAVPTTASAQEAAPETAAATAGQNPVFSQKLGEIPAPSENPVFSQKLGEIPAPSENPVFSQKLGEIPAPSESPVFSQKTPAPRQSPEVAGRIDYLINSAGLALGLGSFAELPQSDADEMIDTNIKGTLNACRAAIPFIPHGGAIVNFGSIAGAYPYPGGHVYCGTKAFVQQFSDALRCDFAAAGVRVSTIAPGLAKTNFSLTRFKGDAARAESVYAHTNYLSAADVAAATFAVLDLPPHVNVTYLELMPQTQTPAALNTAPASFGAQQ